MQEKLNCLGFVFYIKDEVRAFKVEALEDAFHLETIDLRSTV